MRRYKIYIGVCLVIQSCFSHKPKDCVDYEDVFVQDSCRSLTLRVDPGFTVGTIERFLIWSKYGVSVEREVEIVKRDSCYYLFMENLIIEERGSEIIQQIRSELKNFSKIRSDGIQYFDGPYSFLLDFPRGRTEGSRAPFPLDVDKYNDIVDSLGCVFSQHIENRVMWFWVTINSEGKLESIDFPHEFCIDNVDTIVWNSLRNMEWEPAVFENKPVSYRYEEYIAIFD